MASDHDGHTLARPPCKPSCLVRAHQPDRALIDGRCARCGGLLDGRRAARILKARGIARDTKREGGA